VAWANHVLSVVEGSLARGPWMDRSVEATPSNEFDGATRSERSPVLNRAQIGAVPPRNTVAPGARFPGKMLAVAAVPMVE
jgi:hypothetical protein